MYRYLDYTLTEPFERKRRNFKYNKASPIAVEEISKAFLKGLLKE